MMSGIVALFSGSAELHSSVDSSLPGSAELHSAGCQPSIATPAWRSRGYLPHHDHPGLIQHITFHVADSLPADAIARMESDVASMTDETAACERRQRIQDLLDAGHGSCPLRPASNAAIVEASLFYGDGERYRLLEWVVMPNHVHVLIEQLECSLATVVQSWKRHTSREIHRQSPAAPSPLWQREYWDRYVRDAGHLAAAVAYIHHNPVVAGLAASPQTWPSGSARFRQPAECNSALPGSLRQPAECNSALPGSLRQPAECNSALPGNS